MRLITYFSRPNVWETAIVPRLVIDNLMWDETQHTVRVEGGSPSWLMALRLKRKLKTAAICDLQTTAIDEAAPDEGVPASKKPSCNPCKRRRRFKKSRTFAQCTGAATAWGVLVVRRSISWLTLDGRVMECPLVIPQTLL